MSLQFEWDSRKATANFKKHKVSFDEAISVFDDPLAIIFPDEEHSEDEAREIIIGYSLLQRLLIVCFVDRFKGTIRIISARAATKREKKDYQEHAGT